MSTQVQEEIRYKPVKTILVSQPAPAVGQKSQYADIEQKYGVKVDFREFTNVESVLAKEVRKQKVNPVEFGSVILNSRHAVDHFFRICGEMRIKMSEDTRYFCMTENIANYLQKFIVYRKRRVIAGVKTIEDLKPFLIKYKDKGEYLIPCGNAGAREITAFMQANSLNYKECVMFETVSSDLSDLADITYDVLVFFNAQGIKSLFDNFPDFKQNETRLAIFGKTTVQAVKEHEGLVINIEAPLPDVPSMSVALERYIKIANKV